MEPLAGKFEGRAKSFVPCSDPKRLGLASSSAAFASVASSLYQKLCRMACAELTPCHALVSVSVSYLQDTAEMAPTVGLGHAATALSLLALGLNAESRLRAGGLAAAPGPELQSLEDKVGQLQGTQAGQQATIAGLSERTARCEALLGPLEEHTPAQSAPAGARGFRVVGAPRGKARGGPVRRRTCQTAEQGVLSVRLRCS